MDNPQRLSSPILDGASPTSSPSDINPDGTGVDFIVKNPVITIPLAPGASPILVEIALPKENTNVKEIRVIVTGPEGSPIFDATSPPGTNKIDEFPATPIPENSVIVIIPLSSNGQPPENVTVSVLACYTPSTGTTVVTSGSVPPSVTGTTPLFTVSSTSSSVTEGMF